MKKQILTGAEFFEEIIEGDYFYIDKTLFIKELLENKGKVTLITRPRRFGKTLNMNMLEQFFDVGKNSERLFEGLAIAGHKDIVEKHQNKYPVVSITLKNVEERTYGETIENIGNLVSEMYEKKLYLYEGDTLNERQKERFHRFWMNKATDMELKSSLSFLTDCLQAHHKKRAIVLVDEYDTPIANASAKGFYADMIEF
ncbi:MAG: AAA family ATPase, partial [Oscillospiraceae bacterium]|nr:AAA family ATPase [Oscillospiraceae bacterium]